MQYRPSKFKSYVFLVPALWAVPIFRPLLVFPSCRCLSAIIHPSCPLVGRLCLTAPWRRTFPWRPHITHRRPCSPRALTWARLMALHPRRCLHCRPHFIHRHSRPLPPQKSTRLQVSATFTFSFHFLFILRCFNAKENSSALAMELHLFRMSHQFQGSIYPKILLATLNNFPFFRSAQMEFRGKKSKSAHLTGNGICPGLLGNGICWALYFVWYCFVILPSESPLSYQT